MSNLEKEITRRRTFAIISHPDAGKTTITEKLLLYGGAIDLAGTVKAKRGKKFATSDWMELEKQRGISVTSSVMKFPYKEFEINLIDTPGHQDFSEDTYRTLTAVDAALMLIDAGNGVEAQTIKLFEVCRLRKIPILAFINKMDRPGKKAFDLMDEIEKVLGIHCFPVTWPIGQGDLFRGVFDRMRKELIAYEINSDRSQRVPIKELSLESPEAKNFVGEELIQTIEDLEMLDGAGEGFSHEKFLKGEMAPLFFGSALNNFGVERLLDALVELVPGPVSRKATERDVNPLENKFTGFIFKIQANMDPNHRDRVAFIRICSGKFERGMKAFHVRHKKEHRLGRPTQFMARDRSLVDEAYAGDIVGVHDPGIFKIGDTLTEGESLHYSGIPVFAPEHFVRVELQDPLKSKQLMKALDQLSEEGALQVFKPLIRQNDRYLGVVGALQFDVVKYRIENEYGVRISLKPLNYSLARWVHSEDEEALKKFLREEESIICHDSYDHPVVLMDEQWRIKFLTDRHPKILFHSTDNISEK